MPSTRDPRPSGAAEYGSSTLHRLRVGRYRLLYEISDTADATTVIHVGRIG